MPNAEVSDADREAALNRWCVHLFCSISLCQLNLHVSKQIVLKMSMGVSSQLYHAFVVFSFSAVLCLHNPASPPHAGVPEASQVVDEACFCYFGRFFMHLYLVWAVGKRLRKMQRNSHARASAQHVRPLQNAVPRLCLVESLVRGCD